VSIVGHGWGAAFGLAFAQRHPERIERIVIIDALPLLDGFQWPRIARRWRRWGLGELLMGSVNRWLMARALRAGATSPQAWSDERIDAVWHQFDQGTQRAILRLHRSIEAEGLAAAGADLGELWAPSLVVWGERDPWLDPMFGDAYARRLPRAELMRVTGAGHWPWLDRPDLVARVAAFVSEI
jgi:4,5:9,10-diseco-3-hydroxy-5,9,17-trioxoandrosta-1(10),2-diene-4-oate hydrolase